MTYNDLCVLHATKKEARTIGLDGERYTYVEPNGTLENIEIYAKLTFNNDTDDTSPDQDIQEIIHQYTLLMDTLDPESQTRF